MVALFQKGDTTMKVALRMLTKTLNALSGSIGEMRYGRIEGETVLVMRSRNQKLTELMNMIQASVRIINEILEGE